MYDTINVGDDMKKILLCIMDGVGYRENRLGNAVKNASTPYIDMLLTKYPNIELEASGSFVGLPEAVMGNSEVGHSTIGSGRIIYQSLVKINNSIRDKSIFDNKVLIDTMDMAKENNKKLHLIGLLSDGRIHSDINHLFTLLEMCKKRNVSNVYIHVVTDGRDTSPVAGIKFIDLLNKKIRELGVGKIATVCGRYYMMDRDNRFDRVELAYKMLVDGIGDKYETASDAWHSNQDMGITDEFIKPSIINDNGMINDGDSVIAFNFRPDRLRELFSALSNKDYQCFDRTIVNELKVVTMMPVADTVKCKNVFSYDIVDNTLGMVISKRGLSQLRIAETEKYAHVTYFFDGGRELKLDGCERILIPSPSVATYDLKPEMSAEEITDTLIQKVEENKYDLVVVNFANGDMVGHTGVYDKGVIAVETVDRCLDRIIPKIDLSEYTVIITADHGNCEQMINDDGSINTQHTTNRVPFIVLDKNITLKNVVGKLSDIAPTILSIMGIDIPKEMNGKVLVEE